MATKRSAYDFYPTPDGAIQTLLDNHSIDSEATIFEPCAGDGAIIKKILENDLKNEIFANELDSSHQEKLNEIGLKKVSFFDYLKLKRKDLDINTNNFVIITNPPFSLAQEFLVHTFEEMQPKETIMLLRLNFLASQKRKSFWKKYPPSKIIVLSKRPSFTGGGTDSQDYAWFIWNSEIYSQQILVD